MKFCSVCKSDYSRENQVNFERHEAACKKKNSDIASTKKLTTYFKSGKYMNYLIIKIVKEINFKS